MRIIKLNGEEPKNLPARTIIEEILEPQIAERLFDVLALCVSKELDVYREQPLVVFGDSDPTKAVKTFDPQDNRTCFMGKKFNNDGVESYVLHEYRKAVGTIKHPVWGQTTLLEIWGADHFKDHREMVLAAFQYGYGITAVKPDVRFFINPLFQNKATGKNKRETEEVAYKKEMDDLLAKAIVFGVKSPAEARRARKRGTRL